MWIEHIRNGQAAVSAFGKDIPEPCDVVLVQLILDPVGGLAVILDAGPLPASAPTRWRERGYDRFQFRMRFYVRDLTIRRQDLETGKVSVELRKGRLRIVSENAAFELTASFDDALVDFYAYQHIRGEPLPTYRLG